MQCALSPHPAHSCPCIGLHGAEPACSLLGQPALCFCPISARQHSLSPGQCAQFSGEAAPAAARVLLDSPFLQQLLHHLLALLCFFRQQVVHRSGSGCRDMFWAPHPQPGSGGSYSQAAPAPARGAPAPVPSYLPLTLPDQHSEQPPAGSGVDPC